MGPKGTPSGSPGRLACVVHTDLATIQRLVLRDKEVLVLRYSSGKKRMGRAMGKRVQKPVGTNFWVPCSRASSLESFEFPQ